MQGSLSAEEAEELERYIDDPSLESMLQSSVKEEWDDFNETEAAVGQEIDGIVAGLESKVQERIDAMEKTKVRTIPLYWRYAAAVAFIFFSLGLLIYSLRKSPAPAYSLSSNNHRKDIAPGTNRATLVFDNGKSIQLSEKMEGISVTENVIRYENGAVLVDHAAQQYLTLAVPRAGKYKLTLSDGTKVWLNAASSLKYPSTFRGRERLVEVQGEAYFEVQHDSAHPFIVKTTQQNVTVLGTAFNVNTYNKDKETTTLVRGRIALTNDRGGKKILLPGDQAVVRGDLFAVSKVNTQDYTAWKDDLIVLNDQDIYDIFRQLERWYDVEFVNMDAIHANKTLSGEIPRNTPLSAILQALEEQTHVKFEINGRRIMIKT